MIRIQQWQCECAGLDPTNIHRDKSEASASYGGQHLRAERIKRPPESDLREAARSARRRRDAELSTRRIRAAAGPTRRVRSGSAWPVSPDGGAGIRDARHGAAGLSATCRPSARATVRTASLVMPASASGRRTLWFVAARAPGRSGRRASSAFSPYAMASRLVAARRSRHRSG